MNCPYTLDRPIAHAHQDSNTFVIGLSDKMSP